MERPLHAWLRGMRVRGGAAPYYVDDDGLGGGVLGPLD